MASSQGIGQGRESEYDNGGYSSSDTALSPPERMQALSDALALLRMELAAARDSDGSQDFLREALDKAVDAA